MSSSFGGVVALDGPSGTGKSTVARRLAKRLGAQYLDTGAMYRAATVAVLDAGVDPQDATAVAAIVSALDLRVSTNPDNPSTELDGRAVDAEIRAASTTAAVSAVSAVPAVRERLVAMQRAIIGRVPTVAEGRDIASVVWPDAEVKIYLTAAEDVRARRRAAEVGEANVADVAADIRRRDGIDSSRADSPLRQLSDAVEVDTSTMTIEQVVDLIEAVALRAVTTSRRG